RSNILSLSLHDALPISLGFGEWLSAPLQLALMHWQRMSEFTADRAGLLACQDADVAIRTMMKLAGLPQKYFKDINTQDFIEQARSEEHTSELQSRGHLV